MSRKSVKVMTYSYFLNLKPYVNTCISITYTESTVSNTLPKGNHNLNTIQKSTELTVSNTLPKGNHNRLYQVMHQDWTVSNTLPKGNHNISLIRYSCLILLVILYRKVITTSKYSIISSSVLLVTINRKVIKPSRFRPPLDII